MLPCRIVIADDSVFVREHLVEMLSGIRGVEIVDEAEDGHAAVASALAHRPEVVVLDIQMPGGNGIEALREIKQMLPDTTVIMLTNHADTFYRKKCIKEGATHFFDKSTEFGAVAGAVRAVVNAAA